MIRGLLLRFVAAILLVAGLFLLAEGGRPALAHADLQSATPEPGSVVTAAPVEVVLRFTEPVEPALTEIRVLNVAGERVDDGTVRVPGTDRTIVSVGLGLLGDGTYTVSWRNVSAIDGHPALGSFIFSVGFPTASQPEKPDQRPILTTPGEPWARWVAITGVLALFGGLMFRLVFDVLASRAGSAVAAEDGERLASTRWRSDVALWIALALALAGSIGHAALVTSTTYQIGAGGVMAGDVFRLIQDTYWGRVWLVRMALLVASGLTMALAATRSSGLRRGAPSFGADYVPAGTSLLFAAGAVTTLSIVSHGAATAGITTLTLATDLLHSFASAVWIGGLIQMAAILPMLLRAPSPPDPNFVSRLTSAVIPQFSVLAGLSAGVLLITGIFSAYAQVTSVAATSAPYGMALIAKSVVIVPLAALAATNLLWAAPRIRSDRNARQTLVRFVWGEVALAIAVLLAVGFMTAMEPARQTRSRELASTPGLEFEDRADGARIVASLQPGTVGDNSVVVHLEDRAGRSIENATSVSGRMRYLGRDLGEPFSAGLDHGDGIWVVHSVPVSIAGPWQLEVLVQRPDAFDANLAWRLEVSAPRAQRSGLTPKPATARLLFGVQVALIGLLSAGVAVAVGGWGSVRGRALSAAGAIAVIAGALFIVRSGALSDDAPPVANQVPANQASIDAGRALYATNCVSCHGESGTGNGPLRAGLPSAPADLTLHVPLHGDRELFRFVHDGLKTMPAWGGQLTDDEIWHLVNYMRTLATPVDR